MDPRLETLILALIRTTNNKQSSQAESPPHLHNNNTLLASSSNDQISEILGPDLEPFKTLISPMMTPSNEQHSQAESLFNFCKQIEPKKLAEKLVELIEQSSHLDVRAMSAILLPKTLLQKPSEIRASLWNSSLELRSRVERCLLDCVRNRDNEPITITLGNTISELAADNRWIKLKDFIVECFENGGWLTKYALLIIAKLGEQYVKDYLLPKKKTDLHRVFMICLENGDLRITALSAAIKFIQCLDYSERKSFKDLLPLMLKCVTEAPNEATARKALLLLKELAGRWPSFFTEQWTVVLRIAEDRNLEEGTKHLAIEVVITAAESRKCVWKQPIINRLYEILMRMLLDIEDEAPPHSAENEDEDAGRSSNYIFGNQCFHRLATALGGDIIVPAVDEYLSALVQIAKGYSKLDILNLKKVVTIVLNSIESHPNHPRVRWAAINAAGQLYADLDPDLQFEYHSRVLPVLADAMCEDLHPRVKLAAINAAGQLYVDLDPDMQFEYHSHVLPSLNTVMRGDGDPHVRLAAINVTVQLFADLDPDLTLTDEIHVSVLQALHGAICDFEYLLVQDRAVSAMISIISINYPRDTRVIPHILLITVGILLERRREEDIASDQTRIRAIRNTLEAFEEELPHDTLTSTLNSLRPEQRAEFRSILEHEIHFEDDSEVDFEDDSEDDFEDDSEDYDW